jgi:hypothetical protein
MLTESSDGHLDVCSARLSIRLCTSLSKLQYILCGIDAPLEMEAHRMEWLARDRNIVRGRVLYAR